MIIKRFFVVVVLLFITLNIHEALAVDESFSVGLTVDQEYDSSGGPIVQPADNVVVIHPSCNKNGVCEPPKETISSCPSDCALPTPGPTPTPTPDPTPTPGPIPTPDPTPTPGPIPTPTPSPDSGTDISQTIVSGVVDVSSAVVEATKTFVNSPVGKVVTGVAKPLGVAAGAAFVVTQAILGTGMMTVTSVSDIYLLIWKLVGILVGSSKRRGRPWGTVYDAVTKRPLDPAYVVVSRATGEDVSDAITDLDGRYGFLIPSGTYKLKASKTNYEFPAKSMEDKTSDEIYSNIYHGEEVTTKEGDVLIENIPLDPIGFDWNEFAKNKQNLFRIYSERERFWNRIFDGIYFVGFLSAFIATLFDPRPVNFAFLILYFLFIAYSSFKKRAKKAVVVKNKETSMPIPYAVIKVFFAEVDNQMKTVVADHLGRFYFLVGPGRYYVTVDEKQLDGTYKTIHKSNPMDLKHGVLNADILI